MKRGLRLSPSCLRRRCMVDLLMPTSRAMSCRGMSIPYNSMTRLRNSDVSGRNSGCRMRAAVCWSRVSAVPRAVLPAWFALSCSSCCVSSSAFATRLFLKSSNARKLLESRLLRCTTTSLYEPAACVIC